MFFCNYAFFTGGSVFRTFSLFSSRLETLATGQSKLCSSCSWLFSLEICNRKYKGRGSEKWETGSLLLNCGKWNFLVHIYFDKHTPAFILNNRYAWQILKHLEFSLQTLDKHSNVKLYENSSIDFRFVPNWRTDISRQILALRDFANSPKIVIRFPTVYSQTVSFLNLYQIIIKISFIYPSVPSLIWENWCDV